MTDLTGELMETTAPFVGYFNPAAGAAFAIGGSVLQAIEDNKVTMGEVFDIGKSVLDAVGLGSAYGSGLETVAGINAIADRQVLIMLEKQINGEGITQEDVNILRDLITLFNNENMQRAERSGKKNRTNAAAGGGAEGAGGASGAEGASGASGQSIFELIAAIFGDKMKDVLGRLESLAKDLEKAEGDEIGKLVPQFSAAAQEFSFLSQSFNTGINALGEGLKNAARKQ